MNEKSKRLVKNTFFLYVRMFFLMFISFFSTRIVLNALGASDFGIYNVVCGFVAMLTFLSGALGNATQRFLSYELEKKNLDQLTNVFFQIKRMYFALSLFVLLLGETIGLWLVNAKLNIPLDRMSAVCVIYQCSIISTILTLLSVPYNALIIAHENMKIFAVVGMFEGGAKLAIAFVLIWYAKDRLVLYGIALAFVAVVIRFFYYYYCKRFYLETRTHDVSYDFNKIKEIGTFAGWSLFGSISTMANSQGINMIINIFFGTIVNAARGISYQVDSAVRSFISNFQTALNPQIVKAYSSGNIEEMHSLIFLGSKMSFFIMFVLTIPIIVNLDYILPLWLANVPDCTKIFTQLILINSLVVTFSGPLSIAAQATGKIRGYQMFMGSFLLLNLPIAYILFHIGYPAYYSILISIIIESFLLFMRLLFLKRMIKLQISVYFGKVLCPSLSCVLLCVPLCIFFSDCLKLQTFCNFVVSFTSSFLISCFIVFFVGLSKNQQFRLLDFIKLRLRKRG